MASQAPEHKQWHSNVGLDEFVGHVLKFKYLVDSTQTRELGTVDKEQLKKMMGWGLFIEQVRGPLSSRGETFCCEHVSTSSFHRVLLRCDPYTHVQAHVRIDVFSPYANTKASRGLKLGSKIENASSGVI